MPIEKDALLRCLFEKLGFQPDGGTKHDRVALYYDGGKVNTYLGRHKGKGHTIDDGLLDFIAGQMRLTMSELRKLCRCELSREWYLSVVKTRSRWA